MIVCASVIIMKGNATHTRSHSQLGQYAKCSEAFRLQRIVRAPSRPAWWFPGGTAVHATIEAYLKARVAEQQNGLKQNP